MPTQVIVSRVQFCFAVLVGVGVPALAVTPRAVRAQQFTIVGKVVEPAQSSLIGGATVRIPGFPPRFTGLDGAFRFTGIAPGRYTLTIEALGYRPGSVDLVIRTDTTLVIELTPDPIRLDSLLVRGGSVRIRGNIVDAATGERLLWARVTVIPGFPTVSANDGRFTVRNVPRGRAVAVVVEAIEYLPARIALITDSDTSLTVELNHDSVGIRMLAEQVKRLEVRSDAVSLSRRVYDRDDLARARGWTVYDLLRIQVLGRPPSARCLFIDDVQRGHPEFLQGLMAGEVERIEVFRRGAMIRIYTKRFAMSLLGKRGELGPIFYSETGLGTVCR